LALVAALELLAARAHLADIRLVPLAGALGLAFLGLCALRGRLAGLGGLAAVGLVQAFGGRLLVCQSQRIEIRCNLRQRLLVGRVDQPHDQEERHHRRHEVGVGDLPHAAVMAALVGVAAAADDDELVRVAFLAAAHAAASFIADTHAPSRVSIRVWPAVTLSSLAGPGWKEMCSSSPARCPRRASIRSAAPRTLTARAGSRASSTFKVSARSATTRRRNCSARKGSSRRATVSASRASIPSRPATSCAASFALSSCVQAARAAVSSRSRRAFSWASRSASSASAAALPLATPSWKAASRAAVLLWSAGSGQPRATLGSPASNSGR